MKAKKRSAKAESPAKTKPRSPNYPAIGLRDAVARVASIYKVDGRAGAPNAIAAKHMGYNSLHGKAITVLSAISKFGLTQNKGGRIIPTQSAVDIIEFPVGHDRHDL